MKICDRCEGRPITLPLMDSKDHIHYDLCKQCEEAFYMFMASVEVKIYNGSEDKPEKRGPGRPKKNGTD